MTIVKNGMRYTAPRKLWGIYRTGVYGDQRVNKVWYGTLILIINGKHKRIPFTGVRFNRLDVFCEDCNKV